MYTVYGVALGPGDPELLTLKALRILKEADIIFYPGSSYKGKLKSFVYPILEYHGLTDKKLEGFFLQMSLNRISAEEVYDQTVINIEKAYLQHKKVAIVCEGDLSLYASFSYILNRLKNKKLPVGLIPGINAFSLGAARHQVPLCLLNEKVAIVPREKDVKQLESYFQNFEALVLMKIRSSWGVIQELLFQKKWRFYYCERLGTEEEFISTDLNEISKREIPYFSLLIIKKYHTND
ncbi:MAG: precorrin-2 C(20)-methyltransferase [Flavobacteriaceae bacterium]|nr:precorrin-2 C(20)-methyltransferase [Flavobacteriaceae bacterium]